MGGLAGLLEITFHFINHRAGDLLWSSGKRFPLSFGIFTGNFQFPRAGHIALERGTSVISNQWPECSKFFAGESYGLALQLRLWSVESSGGMNARPTLAWCFIYFLWKNQMSLTIFLQWWKMLNNLCPELNVSFLFKYAYNLSSGCSIFLLGLSLNSAPWQVV